MLGELGGEMEDDYSLPQAVEEVDIPSTKDEAVSYTHLTLPTIYSV